MEGMSRCVRFASKAKCRETTTATGMHYARLKSVLAITHFQTGVSWHFHLFKDQVLKIEL